MLNTLIEDHAPGVVKLTWWYGDPIRGLTARESAEEWARRVLGAQL